MDKLGPGKPSRCRHLHFDELSLRNLLTILPNRWQGVEDGVTCEDQSIRGLIPRVFEYLFSRIEELKAQDIQVLSVL